MSNTKPLNIIHKTEPKTNLPSLHFFLSPLFWLAIAILCIVLMLNMSLSLPIGPMYWDTYLYLDAAHRIWNGQVPHADFLTPVGALGYYLFAWCMKLFPTAQPLLLAQWSMFIFISIPMALCLQDVGQRSRNIAFMLLIPFLIFGIFPANVQSFQSYPGVDGFGIYNRQVSLQLYVLMSGLLFMHHGKKIAIFCAFVMLSLFLTKITGFLVGGLFGLTALLSGRLSFRSTVIAATLFIASLLLLELNADMISAYLLNIKQLVSLNEGALLPRFLTVMSGKLDVILPAAILVLLLFWVDFTTKQWRKHLFDSSALWFGIALLGGIILETQNTGSQEFIFLWPVLIMIYPRFWSLDKKSVAAFLVLAAFCIIPSISAVSHKVLRALAVSPTYIQLPAPNLKNMQQVSTRPDILERASLLKDHYAQYGETYQALANQQQLPSWRLYAELDYQIHWLLSANEMINDFMQLEKKYNLKIDSLMTLDFTDPFPWLLNRKATPYIQIGADPSRTVPAMSEQVKAAIQTTDAVLRPHCPTTVQREQLQDIYTEALSAHTLITLNPCWDIFVRNKLLTHGPKNDAELGRMRQAE